MIGLTKNILLIQVNPKVSFILDFLKIEVHLEPSREWNAILTISFFVNSSCFKVNVQNKQKKVWTSYMSVTIHISEY